MQAVPGAPKRVGVFVDALEKGERVVLKTGHSYLLQDVAAREAAMKGSVPIARASLA